MTADYRAAFEVDWPQDKSEGITPLDLPNLVLYGADGAMARHFDVPATWRPRFTDLTAEPIPGGHFFIDQHPDLVGQRLRAFLDAQEHT